MDVDLYADPSCPWSWAAYLWLDEVASRRQVQVAMRPFSLLLRDGTGHLPPSRRAGREQAHRALRVAAAIESDEARNAFYAAVTGPVYAALAAGRSPTVDVAAALRQVGLDPALAALADDARLDAKIARSMRSLAELLPVREPAVPRIPVIVLHAEHGPVASHGPLLDPVPRGREAVQLWDATDQLLRLPGVYGLTRPRPASHSLVAAASR
jgi:2-hydroxychromene-2-carboxylate isomerase